MEWDDSCDLWYNVLRYASKSGKGMSMKNGNTCIVGGLLMLGAVALCAVGEDRVWPPPRAEERKQWIEKSERLNAALEKFGRTWHDGRLADAEAMIAGMPEGGGDQQVSQQIDELVVYDLLTTAKKLIEHYPGARPSQTDKLLGPWEAEGDVNDQMHEWLAGLSQQHDFWLRIQARHLGSRHPEQRKQLLEKLTREVQTQSADFKSAHRLAVAARVDPHSERYDWIGSVFQSPHPSDYVMLCEDYGALTNAQTQVGLYLRALGLTPDAVDREWIEQRREQTSVIAQSERRPDGELRNILRLELLDAYKRAREADKAQALMEEMMRENGGQLPVSGAYAGQIQAESGQRVVEKQIMAAEAKEGNSATYWRGRGEYFLGRKEWKQAEEAFLKSLKLAEADGAEAAVTRRGALSAYVNCIERVDVGRAYEEFWHRSEGMPPEDRLALLTGFVSHYNTPVRGDDERCWSLLVDCKRWSWGVEQVLMQMLKMPGRNSREVILLAAAALADGADGTRSVVLVHATLRTQSGAKTYVLPVIPLLEYAVRRNAKDADGDSNARMEYQSMVRELWGNYLGVGEWRKAVALMPAQCDAETSSDDDALEAVCVAAAKAGDTTEAMRYWRRVSQLDRMNLRALERLRSTALREQLVQFYQQMERENPGNIAPGRAMAILAKER